MIKAGTKYSMFVRNVEIVSMDDLAFLERQVVQFPNTHGTYIQFNETGKKQYEENKRKDNGSNKRS